MQADSLNFTIRNIQQKDNPAMAGIVRSTLAEFGLDKPGTVYYDETTDALYELFQTEGSIYFIAEKGGEVVGGGGIYPSPGLAEDTCELVKMYLMKEVRGQGLGKELIARSLQFAREAGYRKVYLETMPELRQALKTYEKFGFYYLDKQLGNTGHFGCDLWMMKELNQPATSSTS